MSGVELAGLGGLGEAAGGEAAGAGFLGLGGGLGEAASAGGIGGGGIASQLGGLADIGKVLKLVGALAGGGQKSSQPTGAGSDSQSPPITLPNTPMPPITSELIGKMFNGQSDSGLDVLAMFVKMLGDSSSRQGKV